MKKTIGFLLALAAGFGCAPKAEGPAAQAPAATEIAITVTDEGFQPVRVQVPKDTPVTLAITRTAEHVCVTEAVFAKLGKTVDLPLNQTVRVEIPRLQDTLGYACAMSHFIGVIEPR
jgi:plastocyanin domain-containing protein